jgi:hypothetical protein
MEAILIPFAALRQVMTAICDDDISQISNLAIVPDTDGHAVVYATDGYRVVRTVVNSGTFPNCEQIVPKVDDHVRIEFDGVALAKIVRDMKPGAQGTADKDSIRLVVTPGGLTVHGGMGAQATMNTSDTPTGEISICFNRKYLLDILAQAKGSKVYPMIAWLKKDVGSVWQAHGSALQTVLMPVRD